MWRFFEIISRWLRDMECRRLYATVRVFIHPLSPKKRKKELVIVRTTTMVSNPHLTIAESH